MKIPTNIDRQFGPRSKEVVERRAVAIRKGWRKKTLQFLKSKPTCFDCNEELHHFSRTMLCGYCRMAKNKENHLSRNPGYLARHYQENKDQILAYNQRRYLLHKDQICLRLRIKYAEKRSHEEGYEESLRSSLEREVRAAGLCN